MNEPERFDTSESRTEKLLREELVKSIRNYPKNWREYAKALTPAIIISSVGSAGGQWFASSHGYDSNLAMTASAYVCGYIPGYTYFFGAEYVKNKLNYPNGIFSRKFAEFAGSFMAADYVADITTFTPAFITSNLWLSNNTDIHPAFRSLVAWNGSALLYLSMMAGLHPLTRRITGRINKGLESVFKKIKESWKTEGKNE